MSGKRLLVLGGTTYSCDIIRAAQQLGIYVMVTDYYANSPGKLIADKSFNISATDVDGVVKLIKEENIDGVLTGFSEKLLPYYQQICEKSHCYCYANKDQIEISTNKDLFKDLCRKFSLSVVEEYRIEFAKNHDQLRRIAFPVVIKPTDSGGARGVYVCRNEEELIFNYHKALVYSKSGNIIVEKFMACEEVTIFYLIQDGEIMLSGMADRITKSGYQSTLPLPRAYLFPSKHIGNYQKHVHSKVKKMFEFIGLKNGILFIQSFVDDEDFIFYEMGFRLSPTFEYKIISKINGVNPLHMMIHYALTGKMNDQLIRNNLNPNYSVIGYNLTLLTKPGTIGNIYGIKQIIRDASVIDAILTYTEGDVIPEESIGTLKQVILRVIGVARDKKELEKIIKLINQSFRVISTGGENMLIQPLTEFEILI